VFATTPDLLDDLPYARWLPVVIHPDRWRTDAPVLARDRPRLLHIPTSARLKGTPLVEPVLLALHDEGLIEYVRVEGVAPEEMPAHVADVDIVLDQVVLGAYGAMAVQAMAAGRVVLAHVTAQNRARLPEDPPIVEVDPDSFETVLRGLLERRDEARAAAARGPAYADSWHDGRYAAAVLAPWLGVAAPVGAPSPAPA
jgi:hypothetical protein